MVAKRTQRHERNPNKQNKQTKQKQLLMQRKKERKRSFVLVCFGLLMMNKSRSPESVDNDVVDAILTTSYQ